MLQARADSYKRIHEQHAVGKHLQAGVVSREILEALLDRLQKGQPLSVHRRPAILYPQVLEGLVGWFSSRSLMSERARTWRLTLA